MKKTMNCKEIAQLVNKSESRVRFWAQEFRSAVKTGAETSADTTPETSADTTPETGAASDEEISPAGHGKYTEYNLDQTIQILRFGNISETFISMLQDNAKMLIRIKELEKKNIELLESKNANLIAYQAPTNFRAKVISNVENYARVNNKHIVSAYSLLYSEFYHIYKIHLYNGSKKYFVETGERVSTIEYAVRIGQIEKLYHVSERL